jgi:arylsulfatase A-like enzyme
LLLGLAATAGAEEGRPAIAHGAYQGYNVLLIEVPEVRRDHVSSYGYGRPTTPRLDALAREGVRFEHVVAAAPWCVPGKLAVWTGRYPFEHGVVNKFAAGPDGEAVTATLPAAVPTFPELLREAGYAVVGFTGDAGVGGAFGFSRGFERYVDDREMAGLGYSVPLALAWLREERREPFFLWVQGYDAHGLSVPEGGYTRAFAKDYRGALTGSREEQKAFRERGLALRFGTDGPRAASLGFSPEDQAFYVDLYDEKLQAMDAWLGRLLDGLAAEGLAERTLVIYFAGHGDEFFDHGFLDHAATLYEEQIHVPMVWRLPGGTPGAVVPAQVRTVDIFPTLFALLGLPHPPVTGVSLLAHLSGQGSALEGFSETSYRLFTHQSALVTADRRYKLIYTHESQARELYDLQQDPGERRNLAAADPATADRLLARLLELRGEAQERAAP